MPKIAEATRAARRDQIVAAALAPRAGLSWYQVDVETMVFVVILAAGYGLEYVVAARTGRRALGQAGQHAQDR